MPGLYFALCYSAAAVGTGVALGGAGAEAAGTTSVKG